MECHYFIYKHYLVKFCKLNVLKIPFVGKTMPFVGKIGGLIKEINTLALLIII